PRTRPDAVPDNAKTPTASPPLAVQTTAFSASPSALAARAPPTWGQPLKAQPNPPTGVGVLQVLPPSAELIKAMSLGSRSRYSTRTTPPGSVSRLFQQHS